MHYLLVPTAFKAAVGYDFFIKLNADFMLEIAKEYLQHTLGATTGDASKPGGYLLRGIQVLETLTRFVPGLTPSKARRLSTSMWNTRSRFTAPSRTVRVRTL